MAKGHQGPEDTNQAAFRVVQQLTGAIPHEPPNEEKSGRVNSGIARSANMTAIQRSEKASNAAKTRWARNKSADKEV